MMYYHGQQEGLRMIHEEGFVFKLLAIYRFASRSCQTSRLRDVDLKSENKEVPFPAVKSPPWHMNLPYIRTYSFPQMIGSVGTHPLITRWKPDPLYQRVFPEAPTPFSPVHKAPVGFFLFSPSRKAILLWVTHENSLRFSALDQCRG